METPILVRDPNYTIGRIMGVIDRSLSSDKKINRIREIFLEYEGQTCGRTEQ